MRDFLRRCRFFFIHAAILSLFVNLFQLSVPLYWLQVLDRVLSARSLATLVVLTLLALWIIFFLHLLELLRTNLLTRAGSALDDFVASTVLKRQLDTANRPVGQTADDALGDLARLRSVLSGQAVAAMFDLPWGILFLLLLFLFHPLLGALTVAGATVLGALALYEERTTRSSMENATGLQRRANRFVDGAMRNAEAVAAMGMAKSLSRRWGSINGELKTAQLDVNHRIGLIAALGKFVRGGTRILMLATAAYLVIGDQLSVGVMIAANIMLDRALSPLDSLIRNWRQLASARLAYGRLSRLLGENAVESERLELPEPGGRLEIERVFFRFGQAEPLLRNLSLTLEAGENLGVIGPSGSGKTTLVRLISGLWMPSSGAVRLDGADVFAWDKVHLGRYVGYLPQDVELFDGTVAENICRLGAVDESPDKIVAAAKLAQAHELILRLPMGYDTPLGDGGVRLSGGQKQRIALARALFGTPKLIILDEPNSNLDSEGEEALMSVLREIRKAEITVVCVTHKLSLLRMFDKTLMLRSDGTYQLGRTAEVVSRLQATSAPPALPSASAPAAGTATKRAAIPPHKLGIRGVVGSINDKGVRGWVLFPAKPDLVPTVEIHLGDAILGTTEANLFRGDLTKFDIGTGYHGFDFRFSPDIDLSEDFQDQVQVFVRVPGADKVPLARA